MKWKTKFDSIEHLPVSGKNNLLLGKIGRRKFVIKEFNVRDCRKQHDLEGIKCEILCYENLKWPNLIKVKEKSFQRRFLITKYQDFKELSRSKSSLNKILKLFKKRIEKTDANFLPARDYENYLPIIYNNAKKLSKIKVVKSWKNMIKMFEANKDILKSNTNHFSHGDLRRANIFLVNDKLIVIDFESARRDNLLYDLAGIYIDQQRKDLRKYFYDKISKFSYFDKKIFNLMIIRRSIELIYAFHKDPRLKQLKLFSDSVELYNKLS